MTYIINNKFIENCFQDGILAYFVFCLIQFSSYSCSLQHHQRPCVFSTTIFLYEPMHGTNSMSRSRPATGHMANFVITLCKWADPPVCAGKTETIIIPKNILNEKVPWNFNITKLENNLKYTKCFIYLFQRHWEITIQRLQKINTHKTYWKEKGNGVLAMDSVVNRGYTRAKNVKKSYLLFLPWMFSNIKLNNKLYRILWTQYKTSREWFNSK